VADGTQGVKRSLVDIKTVKKLSMLSDSWKLPTFFGRSLKVCGETSSDFEVFFFRCFSAGSSCRQYQENHAGNTNECSTLVNRYHQHFPIFRKSINIGIPAWCNKVT